MKQHITEKQIKELTADGCHSLQEYLLKKGWWNPMTVGKWMKDDLPLLSIGQMIEFLEDNFKYQYKFFRRTIDWKLYYGEEPYEYTKGLELADALWEAVKEILER